MYHRKHQNMSVSISANMRYKICDILLNVLKPQLLIKLFSVPYKHNVTMSLEFIKWLQVLIVKLIYYYSFNICLINLFVSIILFYLYRYQCIWYPYSNLPDLYLPSFKSFISAHLKTQRHHFSAIGFYIKRSKQPV